MALSNVFINTTDGNIANGTGGNNDKVTGLIFDVSKQKELFTAGYGLSNISRLKLNDILYITNRKQAINEFGIIKRVEASEDEETVKNFMHGIPYYHIEEFYRMQGNVDGEAKLFVMFADCSTNWDAIEDIQRASGGTISQLGIWTEQPLWKLNGEAEEYNINLVSAINDKAEALGKKHMPLSVVVSASTSNTGASTTTGNQVDLNKIPNAISQLSKVSVIIGQSRSETINLMQKRNANLTQVGFLGAVMGCIALASVSESIAWVKKFNLISDDFQNIELGFGDLNLGADDEFVSTNFLESISDTILDELDDKGYIFPVKYAGVENGVFVSKDKTLSDKDFRTISRNRTIHKSRRGVRLALLPSLNAPVLVDPKSGQLSAAKVTGFRNTVSEVLQAMQNAQEISGFKTVIDPAQNILKTDSIKIGYYIVPVGVSSEIYVEESLSTTNA